MAARQRSPSPKGPTGPPPARTDRSAPGLAHTAAGDLLAVQRACGNRAAERLVAAPYVQRFGELEHKTIGDRASGYRMISLAPGLTVTQGDLVALGGDLFGSFDEMMRLVSNTNGIGRGTRGEFLYALKVEIRHADEKPLMGKEFDESAKKAVKERYYRLASNNPSHFTNPLKGDQALSIADKASRREKLGTTTVPVGGAGNYRDNHVRAIEAAAVRGRNGLPLDPAMAIEAFGEHYLTDMFSAGHVRTERTSAPAYWAPMVPMFAYNFKGFLAEFIAKYLEQHGDTAEKAATVEFKVKSKGSLWGLIPAGSQKGVSDALRGKPDITFGDVVALAIHDYDSHRGVKAVTGGVDVDLAGDGGLVGLQEDPKTKAKLTTIKNQPAFDAVVTAVRLSIAEVTQAYADGGKGIDPTTIVQKQLAVGGGTFAAEKLIPEAKPDAALPEQDRSLRWEFDTVDDLLNDRPMQLALSKFAENKAGELEMVKEGQSKTVQAAITAIQNRMRGGPTPVVGLLREIISWTPDTGGGIGGRVEDDSALEYWRQARLRGAVGTLTWTQKARLIGHVLSGVTTGSEQPMVNDLLGANQRDALTLIGRFGWRRFLDELTGDERARFVRTFGSAYWSTQGFGAKRLEVLRRYQDAARSTLAEETILMILRTCSASEVRKLDAEVRGFDLSDSGEATVAALKGTRH